MSAELKTKPQNFNMLKFCKNTFLICVLVAILAFVMFRLPFSDSLTNFTRANIFKSNQDSEMSSSDAAIFACDFEVFGRVQGVFFRKFTQKTAKSLQLKGWCQNTSEGTVRGQIEGPKRKIDEMKKWLQETGSPQSRIDRTIFSDTTQIEEYRFKEFSIRR